MRDFVTNSATSTSVASNHQIYMDHNGSAPTHPDAVAAMVPLLSAGFGNPSSGHWSAHPAKAALENARKSVARFIGARAEEIVFTSGGTEANNMVLKGIVDPRSIKRQHIITSAIEHDAILKPLRALRQRGVKITIVPVDGNGIVDPQSIKDAITDETSLITIMMANNEVGTIQPIAEIGKIAAGHKIPFHTDAAQSVGKIPVDVDALGVDFLSIAGHKFGAPNGIGALFIRKGQKLTPLFHGAGHENGRRAGTESALLAAGMGAAAKAVFKKDSTDVRTLRDHFWKRLQTNFGDKVVLNGHVELRVPNTLNVSFPGYVGADLLASIPGLAATTGSACHAGCVDMSHVLIAMGKSLELGLGAVRFSLGATNTVSDVEYVVDQLRAVITQ